jgi:transcriptional regulator with XRE-family HTH domain
MSDRLPNAIDRHVASRLRLRRLEAGLSQTTLADALGISFQQLQKYEGAINRISAGALYQLALTLDVPVQYFFDGLSRLFNRIMSRCHSDFCAAGSPG